MAKSIGQINNENKGYYFKTYSSQVTRSGKIGLIVMWVVWAIGLIFMKVSYDRLYYYRLSKAVELGNQEINDWIWEQIRQNWAELENAVILLMIVIVAILFWHYWHIKSYELHLRRRMYKIVLSVMVMLNVVLTVLMLYRDSQKIISILLSALADIFPFAMTIKCLLPIEIKKKTESIWRFFDLSGYIIKKL